jgi:hypothetical protein
MPKKTLALISGLVLVTLILFVIALNNSNTTLAPSPAPQQLQNQVSPAVPAHSVLSLSPNPVTVVPGQRGSVAVNINTSDNAVTAVQLEIGYDPTIITNVQVTPGGLFQNPIPLINRNDVKTGRFTYAYGITPNSPTIQGAGSVATITFTALNKPGQKSQLALLPTSLVTAQGISNSVLKSATGTLVVIGQPGPSVNIVTPE